jgi:hypothetical protein
MRRIGRVLWISEIRFPFDSAALQQQLVARVRLCPTPVHGPRLEGDGDAVSPPPS